MCFNPIEKEIPRNMRLWTEGIFGLCRWAQSFQILTGAILGSIDLCHGLELCVKNRALESAFWTTRFEKPNLFRKAFTRYWMPASNY